MIFGMEISRGDCIRYKIESKMLTEFIFFALEFDEGGLTIFMNNMHNDTIRL